METPYYILDGTDPVPCADVLTWSQWFEQANRRVAETWITPTLRVATVFLGVHFHWGPEPPLLFETMVVRDDGCQEHTQRYATWQDAEQGHRQIVETLQETFHAA